MEHDQKLISAHESKLWSQFDRQFAWNWGESVPNRGYFFVVPSCNSYGNKQMGAETQCGAIMMQ